MVQLSTDTGLALPLRTDAIRIVPVRQIDDIGLATDEVGAGPPPALTYRGGQLLTSVQVFTLFWGAKWSSAQASARAQVNQFFDFILSSAMIDQLSEYSTSGMTIGHGAHVGTATVTAPAPPRSVSDGALQHFLQQEIATNSALPKPSPQTLYFMYLPPGTSVSQGGTRSCQAFCGYHNDISGQILYAVMPYPGCGGCTGGLAVNDALTVTSSHELCEAITDPVPGTGWYDDSNGEIGDICAWQTKTVGAFMVQKEWSNQANSCQ